MEIVVSDSAAARLDAAASFLRRFSPHSPITIVAATRGAADDLARRVALERGATIGLARYSLTQIAARAAAVRLAGRGIAPATASGSEAVAARCAFDASGADALEYFGPVAKTPGFPRALAQTLGELRAVGTATDRLSRAGPAAADLARLLECSERELEAAAVADRAALFGAAAEGIESDASLRAPLLLLDVAPATPAEERFVALLVARAGPACATVPGRDEDGLSALQRLGSPLTFIELPRPIASTDLDYLRTHLFSETAPPARALDGSVSFFSAPGEGRECVEIVRRIVDEARRGVPFDEIAILVRSPQHYQGLLEHALSRAGVPACLDRGTKRPDPAGRAFLALLACADEGLSASRFAEYLSLGQVPSASAAEPGQWMPSLDEALLGMVPPPETTDTAEPISVDEERERVAGTLPAPRHWERMLVDAAVIGGDPARWARRLAGLESELQARIDEAQREDHDAPQAAAIARDLARLVHLRAFALPIVGEMASWPRAAHWGNWLGRLEQFAPRVLRVPAHVLRVLADLRPMAAIGPATLAEVRSVLAPRLRSVEREPPARRYGRVFVATPAQARGRAFRVVFVPGLAERMFPQKPRQDPLLQDTARERLDSRLQTQAHRGRLERLLLHLAAGAARERLYVSYPRLDVGEGRSRVPSFYALDVLRGATGRIPDHETLAHAAAAAGDATLAWPAPREPAAAIDDQEHDLAILRQLLDADDLTAARGRAHYMLGLNPALRRSVVERWARNEPRWRPFDGITRITDRTRAALARQRLTARPYSVSALQKFAACPYQFLLSAVYRLEPAGVSEPLQRLDPLTKGSLVHRVQAQFLRRLRDGGALPITETSLEAALRTLDAVIGEVEAEYRERLVPAIERVWAEEIGAIARDLRGWVRHVAAEDPQWTPRHFELAFGLPADESRDPHSRPEPVSIDGRFTLRGSIDLIEEHPSDGTLRVTDHKTGTDRSKEGLTIGGGSTLQPVLYSLAVEQLSGRQVAQARLFFCTSAGGYRLRPVRLTPEARRMGIEALEIIDRAVETGFLAAAPADGACGWCAFRPVCGPNEEQRIARKPADRLRDLFELRSRP